VRLSSIILMVYYFGRWPVDAIVVYGADCDLSSVLKKLLKLGRLVVLLDGYDILDTTNSTVTCMYMIQET